MSILLRYLNRTDDDFKSFVSFLNLKNSEILLSSEKLHIVLSGISELTTNIVQQRTLLNNLVENKFNGIIYKGVSSNEIFENAKKYAKSELEKQIEKLESQKEDVITKKDEITFQLEENEKSLLEEVDQLRNDKSENDKKLSDKDKENEILKNKLKCKEFKEEYRKWQYPAYWLLLLGFLILTFVVFFFVSRDWQYNYSYKLIQWIETNENSVLKTTLTTLVYSPIIALGLICVYGWEHLIRSEKMTDAKKKINDRLDEKYK